MSEVIIGENTYVIGKLNAMKQFHLSRRLLPILQKLIPAFVAFQGVDVAKQDFTKMASAMGPAVEALSEMSDADSEYVVSLCLSVVKKRNDKLMVPVWNDKLNAPMFEDMGLQEMLQLTWEVIGANLGSFIQGSGLTATPQN